MITRHKIILSFVFLLALLLRSYKLGEIPVSLHGDEVGVGYNAYSLLTTGKDEYGVSWPISLRADIPPLNFYVTAAVMAITGKSEIAIRTPGLIYGMSTIVVTYFLVRRLFSERVALLSSFFLAVSPWHVQVSRIAHEASLGVLLQVAATWCFVAGLKRPVRWAWAAIFFGLSMYAYHGPRLTTPLLILSLILVYRKHLRRKVNRHFLVRAMVILSLMMLPIVVMIISRPFTANRWAGISILIRDVTLALPRQQAGRSSTLATVLFHNPLVVYLVAIAKQYFAYINWNYLFFDTSELRYFNVSRVGLVYLWELPFLMTGLYTLIRSGVRAQKFPLLWLLIAPSPGMITLGTPNVGRSLMLMPMLQVVIAVGVVFVAQQARTLMPKKVRLVAASVLIGLLFYSTSFFMHQYLEQSKYEFSAQWDYGVKQAVEYIQPFEEAADQIVFTTALKQPYIFVLFYGNKDYNWIRRVGGERHQFIGYKSLGKYEFRPIDFEEDQYLTQTLLVGTGEEIPASASGIVREISAPDESVAFRIVANGL